MFFLRTEDKAYCMELTYNYGHSARDERTQPFETPKIRKTERKTENIQVE